MTPHNAMQNRFVGYLLVTLQFALLAVLVLFALPTLSHGSITLTSAALAVLAALLGGWTLAHNRLGNFNIHPTPKARGVLVTKGPYRYMRHPMYSSVLLGAAALATLAPHASAWFAWAALLLDLWLKARLEERWLAEKFTDYTSYCGSCKRFVPWLF